MADEQDIKIAVLETKVDGLRDQHKAQSDRIVDMLTQQNTGTNDRFNKLTEYIKPAVEFAQINKDIPGQVKVLWDFHQQNRGFLSATRILTATIGGIVVAIADFFMKWSGK